ncbi:MAG: MlaD family protein [Rikenellaceae bacterium]|jgi:phospholipid/cholesterol/gamma-HCH transport system substrate-binding protein|nr:MlaD family protein [Rikenellaceae bacterium]
MRKEVKIGIFAFLMLILLFWGINFLKGKNLFTTSHTFYTTFRDVDGLNVSGDVMFRGMKVGTITDIVFNPQTPGAIVVEFTVPRKYPVPNDSRITTINPYIIGGKVMVVEYGHSPEMYQSGDTIPSVAKPELLTQLSDAFEPLKDQLSEIVTGLNRTLNGLDGLLSEQNLQSLSGTFANVERLTGSLQTSANNINAITANLRDNGENIDRILTNASEFSDSLRSLQLSALVGDLSATLAELNGVIEKANSGDGSLALLLNDPALYEGLQTSSENLSGLLEDLKANPGRYVHFSLFGRKEK